LLAHVAAQCSLALHNARLYELAITDELTQVYQRRYYDMVLRDLVEKKEAFGLILIDLNEFKLINDTLGHAVGDQVLKAVGREMKRCLRASDLPARIGGDEFAVILPGETTDHIERVVEKLRAAFARNRDRRPGPPAAPGLGQFRVRVFPGGGFGGP
jgi:diguanylate cyclase (GGDEF)-like protein